MSPYEALLSQYEDRIEIKETFLKFGLKGLYHDGKILIDRGMCETKKHCVLSEELGHHFKTFGIIVHQKTIVDIKQENRGRQWGYKKIVPLEKFIEANEVGCMTKYEVMDYLNVTEEFFNEVVSYYFNKYGKYKIINGYTIYFEPLNIMKNGEINVI